MGGVIILVQNPTSHAIIMPPQLSLNYWIFGASVLDGVDVIRIDGDLLVADLRTVLGKRMEIPEDKFDKLKLYRVSLSPYELDGYEHVQPEWPSLSPIGVLSTHFQDLPRERIHVVVDHPRKFAICRSPPYTPHAFSGSIKRPASPTPTAISQLLESKLARLDPSSIARPSKYQEIQNSSSQRIFNDRPKRDKNVAPISLLYTAFGSFIDVFTGKVPVPLQSLMPPVDQLADAMSGFFPNDMHRMWSARFWINNIFGSKGVPSLLADGTIPMVGSIGEPGAFSLGPHGGPLTMLQVNSSDPDAAIQAVSSIAHIHARMKPPFSDLLDRWRIPCLVIVVGGEWPGTLVVIAKGCAILSTQVRILPFTPSSHSAIVIEWSASRLALVLVLCW